MTSMGSGTRSSCRFAWAALVLALVGASSMLYYELGIFLPRANEVTAAKGLGSGYAFGNDFYPIWLAARECLRERCNPYGTQMTRDIQTGLFGRPLDGRIATDPTDLRMFAHPAYTLLLLWPAAGLPFEIARVAVVSMLALMTATSVLLWMRALSRRTTLTWIAVLLLLTMCNYPVLEGLYAGQAGLLVAFLLAASMLALSRGWFLTAGILLALATIKPQMTVLAILYLAMWSLHDIGRRGRLFLSFFLTMLLLIAAALVVWPNWIQSWVHVLGEYHRYARPSLVSELLRSVLGARAATPLTYAIVPGLIIAAIFLSWRNRASPADSLNFWFTLTLLLAITTITLLPGQAVYDHVILLPGILLLATQSCGLYSNRILKVLLGIGFIVILWPWLATFGLLVLRPLVTHDLFYSAAVLALPLRTAVSFPFVVLGLLVLAFRRMKSAAGDAPPLLRG